MIRGFVKAICIAALTLSTAAGCNKPTEEDCTKAVTNIRRIYGTQGESAGVSPQAMVRSCRGSASPESVKCFIAAQNREELAKCELKGGFSGGGSKAGEGQAAPPQDQAAPQGQAAPPQGQAAPPQGQGSTPGPGSAEQL